MLARIPNTDIDNHQNLHRSGIRLQRLATPSLDPSSTKATDYVDESAVKFSARIGPAAASRQPQNRDSFVHSPTIQRANQELGNFAATPQMSHGVTLPGELAELIAQAVAKAIAVAGFGTSSINLQPIVLFKVFDLSICFRRLRWRLLPIT